MIHEVLTTYKKVDMSLGVYLNKTKTLKQET